MILNIDNDNRRIALSVKRTQPEPWATVGDLFAVEQVVTGLVTQIAAFGAFVRLSEGIEGLIHISELNKSTDVTVREGDTVTVRIVRIDAGRRRIGLSLNTTPDDSTPDAT